MTTKIDRPLGCLAPVPIECVVEDPEGIREVARANGPYFMPARYLISGETAADARNRTPRVVKDAPSYLIGPTRRGDWAFDGKVLVEDSAPLLHHAGFIDAAKELFHCDVVVPEQVYVNLSTPMNGHPFSHVDIPEFVGVNRRNAPGWFLQAMGSSRLFEDARISIATAVAWFHHGERGFFRYWPHGRDAESIRHENMWNTAVVGDNDFMHHLVERVGPRDMGPPEGMSINTELSHDGERWTIVEAGETLMSYDDEYVRLSVSWKAKVYADQQSFEDAQNEVRAISVDEALKRFSDELDESFVDLDDERLQAALTQRWSGYVA